MKNFVYFFNADYAPFKGFYGNKCNDYFSFALSTLKFNPNETVSIQSGDLLLSNVSSQLAASERSGKEISSTYIFDKYLYTSLLIDLTKTMSLTWYTYNIEDFNIMGINLNNIYCITASNLSSDMALQLDVTLRKQAFYIGAAEIDPGNPLHQILFSRFLIPNAYIKDNTIFYKEGQVDFDWSVYFKSFKTQAIDPYEFDFDFPNIPMPNSFSESGKKTSNIFKSKGKFGHHKKVAEAFQKALWDNSIERDTVLTTGNSDEEIIIPENKLANYALNLQHPEGGSKAKFFKEELNIEKEDWRYLAEQIKLGLNDGEVREIRVEEYGIKYHVDIQITGLNETIRTVRTAWIIRPKESMQLVTIHPAKDLPHDSLSERPIIALPKNLEGNDKWNELFRLANEAGKIAGDKHIPTPIIFSGISEPHLEGKLGWAIIYFKDKKHDFVKWLKKSNKGRDSKNGYLFVIRHKSQSAERALAYAQEFSRVLRSNGVDSESQIHLD
ncbi:DUF6883 domain-containing protein [Lysinibacillus fusiformis]|uniref:DUF6883 domain-containing protein n=1 Tax=Lysinibacillus fusiformis TaxID=28031 RepID=UPI0018E605D6|nr:DUF6883 domain-containing protein [Lysinibacillus fusiformis]MBI6865924.1 hypothetical protein [Lysinibacillus fusiformis]